MSDVAPDTRIAVFGAHKMLGAAVARALASEGHGHVVRGPETGLTDADIVERYFERERPQVVVFADGPSGGIDLNRARPADLARDNLLIQTHMFDCAQRYGVRKLLFLASSCVYPRDCAQPMTEDALYSGPLEPTCEAYATARLSGIALCRAYRQQYGCSFVSAIPADVYGPGADIRSERSHVVAALIRRMHEAKTSGQDTVEIWGSGQARREFLYVDDCARACVTVLGDYDSKEPINLGGGQVCSIAELAGTVREVVDYRGSLAYDTSRPDGASCKSLDAMKLRALGWQPEIGMREGLSRTYEWFQRESAETGSQCAGRAA